MASSVFGILALFLANAFPLWFAVTGRWDPLTIVLLFWLETYLLLFLRFRRGQTDAIEPPASFWQWGFQQVFMIVIFAVVHLMVIVFVVAPGGQDHVLTNAEIPAAFAAIQSAVSTYPFAIAVIFVLASIIVGRIRGREHTPGHLLLRFFFIHAILTITAGPLNTIGFPAAAIVGWKVLVDVIFFVRYQKYNL